MKTKCIAEEFSVKSFFLAPHAENKKSVSALCNEAISDWIQWREQVFAEDGSLIPETEKSHPKYLRNERQLKKQLKILTNKFSEEIPRHSPRYFAHMFSEFSVPALLGHLIGLLYNPNNISTESSAVGIEIERLAITELAKMVGFPKTHIGHFTSGGTLANFEMLYRFKKTLGKKSSFRILVPITAHYSWRKGCDLLGIDESHIVYLDVDHTGAMDMDGFEATMRSLYRKKISHIAIISIAGTTELGSFDPIDKTSSLIGNYRKKGVFIWHHIDAAYGGFFATLQNSKDISEIFRKKLKAMSCADSITIDPHKLGYVPYASGCFICKNTALYRIVNHSAPYVDFKSKQQPGPYTIEGSRSASGAIATYLSAKTLGLNEKGLGLIIHKSLSASAKLKKLLSENKHIGVMSIDNTNIVCFYVRAKNKKLSLLNKQTKTLFSKINDENRNGKQLFYVSRTILGPHYQNVIHDVCKQNEMICDEEDLFLIRCTIMNPFIETQHAKSSVIEEFARYIYRCT